MTATETMTQTQSLLKQKQKSIPAVTTNGASIASASTAPIVVAPPSTSTSSARHHSLLSSFTPSSTTKPRLITYAELSQNCGRGSTTGRAWTAVHGHVFDITEFSKIHPGGTQIRLAAGRDSTCLLESYHPLSSIPKVEASLTSRCTYIGILQHVDTVKEKPITNHAHIPLYNRPDDAFFLDVRERVDTYIHTTCRSTRYAYEIIGQAEAYITLALYFIASYYVTFHASWMWTIILGVTTSRMGFLMHMGNHMAVSHSPQVNQIVGWFMDVIGSNAIIWGYEHQVAHHGEPNEYECDNDCEIGAPIVRMHPEIPYHPLMKYQHYLIPGGMTVGFFKWYVGDFEHFVNKFVGNIKMAIDREDWKILIGFKSFWFLLHVVIPLWMHGFWVFFPQLFVWMAIGAHYLENIFIVNHIQNGLVPLPPNAHWSTKQVMATANWKSGSVFWNWISGGLNHQIEHHMFPSLSQYWYPHIASIVEQTCKDHNLVYFNYPDFPTAWMEMWRYLRELGDENFVSKTGQPAAKRRDGKEEMKKKKLK